MIKKIIVIILVFILIFFVFYFYFKTPQDKKITEVIEEAPIENTYTSNIIEDVEYLSKDPNGNEYIIRAKQGEIDVNNDNIIFLKNVSAVIKLNNSKKILINSDFGKYNINNFDTIFSKNVIIDYLDKKIKSQYLDFLILSNNMIISKNVIYTDPKNKIKTDVVEINLENKDINFYMYDKTKKINIISQNWNGNNKTF